MRRFLRVLAVVCLASLASATSTVSGNLADLSGVAVGSRTFVRFELKGCNGNVPRVTTTGVLVPIVTDMTPSSLGVIAGTLYKNSEIDCGGQTGVTTYDMGVWRDGRLLYKYNFTINGGTFNLNSATPNSVQPVVASPTGDTTYLRLDGGNGPFSGNLSIGGTLGVTGATTLGNVTINGTCTGSGCGGSSGFGSGVINVMLDCAGVIGDGLTDDYAAIQACINAHPGKHILFPKVAASNTGATATNTDYYLSQGLLMSGNGQWLDGAVPDNWTGGVRLMFATTASYGIRADANTYGAQITNLELDAQSCWAQSNRATYPDRRGTESLLQGTGQDGIQLLGGEPVVKHTKVQCFQRHGIYLSGDSTIQASSQPDFWRLERVELNSNSGNGIYANGADSNAGVATMIDSRNNALFGVEDNSPLGNTWIGVGTHTNHNNALAAGTTQALTSASVTSNVMTLTTTAALANGVDTVGTWITTAGEVDAGFNTTCKVLTVNSGAKQLTCAFTHANGSTTGGTVGLASTASIFNVWSGAGIWGGCIGGNDGAATWLQPYIELNQGIGGKCMVFSQPGTHIIGGNVGIEDVGNDGLGTFPTQTLSTEFYRVGSYTLGNASDAGGFALHFKPGLTARQTSSINFDNFNGTVLHQISVTGTGFGVVDEADNTFWLVKSDGGNILLRGGTNTEDIVVNQSTGRNFLVYDGAGANLKLKVDTNGVTLAAGNALNSTAGNSGKVQQSSGSLTSGNCAKFDANGNVVDAGNTCSVLVYNAGGTQQTAAHSVFGSCTLGTDCAVTLSGAAVFTSSTSYTCSAQDQTAAAATKIVQSSGSAFTITGTGTDAIRYLCLGD